MHMPIKRQAVEIRNPNTIFSIFIQNLKIVKKNVGDGIIKNVVFICGLQGSFVGIWALIKLILISN